MRRSILLIDDDPSVLYVHGRFFSSEGWEVYRALGGEDGLQLYEEHRPDLVILDLKMPGMNGLEVLERLVAQGATVILLTGHGEVESAVRAMQLGAENFISKPITLDHLGAIVTRALEKVELRRTNRLLAEQVGQGDALALGSSRKMRELAGQIGLLAASERTGVLLLGESGTGKGWVAHRLHAQSPRSRGPFVEVNCAGLSATFLDSELFGHEKGAFTDAKATKRGLFELAHGGTLFLDEVGDLAPELQPKLLKALERKAFRRLGGTSEIAVDVRLIAATNRPLEEAVEAGTFRADLYYRLNVLSLRLPPLRERATEDLLALIQTFLNELRPRHPGSPATLSGRVLGLLVGYGWPGNVRQMRNVLEHAMVLAVGAPEIDVAHLPPELRRPEATTVPEAGAFEVRTLKEVEQQHIERMLLRFGGNRTRASAALGVSRATLHNKIREYGMECVGRSEPSGSGVDA
jgi:two-component system response regulator HydG